MSLAIMETDLSFMWLFHVLLFYCTFLINDYSPIHEITFYPICSTTPHQGQKFFDGVCILLRKRQAIYIRQ